MASYEDGSSPRARGTPPLSTPKPTVQRFIPACAGNTRDIESDCLRTSVHPRVRGEHRDVVRADNAGDGSSPRARGTPWVPVSASVLLRFIPACAGNTTCRVTGSLHLTVHPRVRGEHPITKRLYRVAGGSSPRARGTPAQPSQQPRAERFIPACAGNTQTMTEQQTTDYGSSPRARGTRAGFGQRFADRRFIPACAGNTRIYDQFFTDFSGSSPRARGTHETDA